MDNPKKTPQWDHVKDEILIELVKNKPELYDLTSPHYSDNVVRRRSWVKISKQLGSVVSGDKCKERWECLRSQYRKHINKKIKSGQAATNSQKWKYEDLMSFLSGFMKDRTRNTFLQQVGNESENSDNYDDIGTQELCSRQEGKENHEDDAAAHVTLPQQERRSYKRKKHENNNSASATLMRYLIGKKEDEKASDPIDIFFSLMATTAKKFSPADQHFIKTKVFSLVSEIETKYIHNQNVQTCAPLTQNVCPQPSASPARSHYSTSSSISS